MMHHLLNQWHKLQALEISLGTQEQEDENPYTLNSKNRMLLMS